ncbi:PD-(D/E)XK nuclease family protein, partial [PVC group bacterium]|nr:PD-(D/E)XK nuclease family protein [PVC group bacterium]
AKKENESVKADLSTQEAEAIETLHRICMDLFSSIPDPDSKGQIDFAKLCVGCVDIIQKFVRIRDERDNVFAKAATDIFNMLSRIAKEKMPVTEAIDKLLRVITRIRYGDSHPRPGHVHVAPYRQGGRSGRPYTFIIGMDELKFPGHGFQDPVLLDTERIAIHSYLATSEEKMRKNLFDMAMLLARVRGRLTMSYSAYDVLDDRVVLPSSVLLQVLRVKDGKPEADYTYLAQAIQDLVCFNVGSHTDKHIDAIGWWLDQLTEKNLLKDGTDALRTCYPGISLGLLAQSERISDKFTVYDGLVLPEGDELDPRHQKDMILSASRLEAYAKNPFGFFLEYVLNVERPEETKRDMATWLDSSQRGELLHDVYRRFVDSVKNMKQAPDENKKEKIVFAVLNEVVQEFRETYPPAGEAVFITEVAQLKRDMNVFLRINNQELGIPLFAEMAFGLEDIDPVPIKLKDGQVIHIRGMIDRVDKIGKEYAVWDYKTGSASAYEHRAYVVRGRQIQHALYYKAAEYLLQKKDKDARVTVSGYVLPTEKGERFGRGSVFKRSTSRFDECDRALTLILDSISRGVFIKPDKVEPWMKDADIFGDKTSVMNVKAKMNNEENEELAHLRELKRCK